MELLKVDRDRRLYPAEDIKIGNVYCCVDQYNLGENQIVIAIGIYKEHVRVVAYDSIDDLPVLVHNSSLYKVNQETNKPIFNDSIHYDIRFNRNELIELVYGNSNIVGYGKIIKELSDIVNE